MSWPLGSHVLKGAGARDRSATLCLWGGGWLAADQRNVETLVRWEKHLSVRRGETLGLGLGLGPFESGNGTTMARRVLARFSKPIVVRTQSDVANAEGIVPTILGGDLSFLDQEFRSADGFHRAQSDSHTTIISFPRYGKHWIVQRPWLTEDWYRNYVESIVRRQLVKGTVMHVQFDKGQNGRGDNEYWSHLNVEFVSPNTIDEAAAHYLTASEVYAGRLHAALLAVNLDIPTVAVAYHHKFECVEETGVQVVGLHEKPDHIPIAKPPVGRLVQEIRDRTQEACRVVAPWLKG
ncbi:polysaccharide pyruvyl transferase family protein [Arthrobacter sp. ERGS1:01]|uniref:polysaccharide pyruvyl transferase family protein n=1 Tax=Arthrobacter sp. ERGS1:01 TaxID=1704044 RepID=UPI0023533BBA|nr:polysaccharide pyruvyl transferase family protein [Arthrobacter sp. ERGS1:01]